MKQKPLQIHCVFTNEGEELRQLALRAFSLYLRRILAENDGLVV